MWQGGVSEDSCRLGTCAQGAGGRGEAAAGGEGAGQPLQVPGGTAKARSAAVTGLPWSVSGVGYLHVSLFP